MTDAYPQSVDRDIIAQFLREIGIDVGVARSVTIDLHKVTVEMMRRDEAGTAFAAGDTLATLTVIIPIKPRAAGLTRREREEIAEEVAVAVKTERQRLEQDEDRASA